jgi:hypothetical protein
VHVPVQVDVEDVEQAISALLVPVTSDGVEEMRHNDVASALDREKNQMGEPSAGRAHTNRTTGFMALMDESGRAPDCDWRVVRWRTYHSVPRNVSPSGVFRKTSRPLTWTEAPLAVTSRLPAKICRRVDLPAVQRSPI